VFASNDVMAVGVLSTLRDAGVRVPEDMAVTGFDDIPLARHLSPPLTTVHVDNAELGARAVARLVAALAKGAQGESIQRAESETLPATLVVRRSCGAGERTLAHAMPPPDEPPPD
jgi:LacI family transcriptional regulator